MKNILNSKERSYAFAAYLLSFVITVTIIVAAVYFISLVPIAENRHLRNRINDFETQIFNQQRFVQAMRTSKTLNDSLKALGYVHPFIDRKISDALVEMTEQSEGELYGILNKDIVSFMHGHTVLNKRLLDLNKDLQEIESLKNELSRTKLQLEEANRSLDVYRNSANLGIR